MPEKIGFDAEKYLELQSKHILERIGNEENGRLYLEFGGKLVQDKHAKRILPGFDEDAKIKLLHKLRDKAEIIICVYSGDIATSKTREDFGITYDLEVLRLIDVFRKYDLEVNSVVVSRYQDIPAVNMFINKLERRGIRTYKHYITKGYPTDVETIVSEEGYGANPRIEVTKPLVVVTGPGGGSGKLATSLSQLYADSRIGQKSRYAKFETFPVWNLPLKHPVNYAYEAATADLKDVNMIDNFHLEAYGNTAINYNRDLEVFPIVKRIIEKITEEKCEYNSPTDMGVNMVGYAISHDGVVSEAANQEIIRRYLISKCDYKKGNIPEETTERIKLILDSLGLKEEDRKVVKGAREYIEVKKEAEVNDESLVAVAIELKDGTIITGKGSNMMVAAAAGVLNAIKSLCGINEDTLLISPKVITSIQQMKLKSLNNEKETLNLEEILIALTVTASTSVIAKDALEHLIDLQGCKLHCTAILSDRDEQTIKSLGMDPTSDPEYITDNLYFG